MTTAQWGIPSTRPERVVLSDDSDEEARKSSASARQSHYSSQRGGRPSNDSHVTSKSKGKQVRYQEPTDFENLDEQAVAPPVDRRTHDKQSGLEQNYQDRRQPSSGAQRKRSSDRPSSSRRDRNVPQGEQELTELAAPPPVQRSPAGADAQGTLESERNNDKAGDRPPSDESDGPHQQKSPHDYVGKEQSVPRALSELYTISYLIFFSILGTLARLGTQWIAFYPGTPVVTPVIWANFGGSLVMGFLAEDQELFRVSDDEPKEESTKRKKAIPLYIGLATGFCGSYTSFSAFARDFFLSLSNDLPTPINRPHPGVVYSAPTATVGRNGGYSFEAFLHVVISTLALSLGGLIIGAQIAAFASPIAPRIHGSFIRNFVDPAMVVLGFGCWLATVFLTIWPPDRPGGPAARMSWANEAWRGDAIFALVFAPLGCLLRFYASLKLNGLVPAFPLGTFTVNMLGTAIEGMCFDIQHVRVGVMGRMGGGVVGCQVLQGVLDGFCGCLTTVSTWVAEINGLKREHGWAYAFGTVVGGMLLMIVIMGSVRWSVGYELPICDTGYTSKVHG